MRSVLICSNREALRLFFAQFCESSESLEIVRDLAYYPSRPELIRFVQAHTPDVVFLDFSNLDTATELTQALAQNAPGASVVAINAPKDGNDLLRVLRAGVRDVLESPISADTLAPCIANLARFLQAHRSVQKNQGEVYCFVPAKAGVGASTIALNTALALASAATSTLLCDADLTAGISSFLLNTSSEYSIHDVVEHADTLDSTMWARVVSCCKGLAVIGPGSLGSAALQPEGFEAVIRFARTQYEAVCLDLSGSMEPWTTEVLRAAKHVFLVTTHEVPALYLARVKARALSQISGNITVLLNRTERRQALSQTEIEKMLGLRVKWAFPNDYHELSQAYTSGSALGATSSLGKELVSFAASLTGKQPSIDPPQSPRFLNFFSRASKAAASESR